MSLSTNIQRMIALYLHISRLKMYTSPKQLMAANHCPSELVNILVIGGSLGGNSPSCNSLQGVKTCTVSELTTSTTCRKIDKFVVNIAVLLRSRYVQKYTNQKKKKKISKPLNKQTKHSNNGTAYINPSIMPSYHQPRRIGTKNHGMGVG